MRRFVGALVIRAVMIAAGVALIEERFHWGLYVFGAVLIVSGVRMAVARHAPEPGRNPIIALARRLMPVTPELAGERLVVRIDGLRLMGGAGTDGDHGGGASRARTIPATLDSVARGPEVRRLRALDFDAADLFSGHVIACPSRRRCPSSSMRRRSWSTTRAEKVTTDHPVRFRSCGPPRARGDARTIRAPGGPPDPGRRAPRISGSPPGR
jgi:hypothetical protein